MDYKKTMREVLQLANTSGVEVPVAAAIFDDSGKLLAKSTNKTISASDSTAHAEIEVIRAATKMRGDWRLDDCTLVVTLEPCVMCAGAIKTARIPKVVFGAWDEKVGAAGSRYDILRDPRLGPEVEVISGVSEELCSEILKSYFRDLRH